MSQKNRDADLFVRCLEAADVRYVFGNRGEGNPGLVDALGDSPIRFITTSHEQGAA
jgi:acetolactate synthase-1/2/3 large subunit